MRQVFFYVPPLLFFGKGHVEIFDELRVDPTRDAETVRQQVH